MFFSPLSQPYLKKGSNTDEAHESIIAKVSVEGGKKLKKIRRP